MLRLSATRTVLLLQPIPTLQGSRRLRRISILSLLALLLATFGLSATPGPAPALDEPPGAQLPTGLRLDPAGTTSDLGNFPLGAALTPDGRHLAVLLSGWREQGVQIVDLGSGAVTQTLAQPGAFVGLAFSRDGGTLYASGGFDDSVVRYSWKEGKATPDGKISLAEAAAGSEGSAPAPTAPSAPATPATPPAPGAGKRYPAGIALSPDGTRLYVAENMADKLAVLELPSGKVIQRLPAGHYPYAVAVAPSGRVYVSAWGGGVVLVFPPPPGGRLQPGRAIAAGRHPSALLLNAKGTRLFVTSASTDSIAVIDTVNRRLLATLRDAPPSGPREGCTPNALALSADGTRLYVAEADANAVAVFALSARSAGTPKARGAGRLAGRIPVGWYPTGVLAAGDRLLVLNGKGRGTRPNPGMVQPPAKLQPGSSDYDLGQIRGTLTTIPDSGLADLAPLTRRVARANGWERRPSAHRYPPIRHVLYVIKENRTYDQVLADLPQGDGDRSLLFFPREVSPNHHALAERFGLFDRFFVNAEVSAQGHIWSTAAYVTDYTEKTTPSAYSDRRDEADEGETDEPASGFLWNLAQRKGLAVRIFGELGEKAPGKPGDPPRYRSTKPALRPYTSPTYPAYDLKIPDQKRADAWIEELRGFVAQGRMPALQIFHLPNDHTAGARPGNPTPRAFMADNDLALGRMVEALSRSPFWKDTVVFVLEDDAQAGPDHVDSHRSVLLTISPYNRPGLVHRFVNTTDVIATVEEILHLDTLSQFDHFGRPLRDLFVSEPDLTPYTPLVPSVPLTEQNPPNAPAAAASARIDLDRPDAVDDDLFNRILWRTIKGEAIPYPGAKTMPLHEIVLGR